MSTKIFNLTLTSAPIPGPSFLHARDKDGKSTGRHTFTLVRGAMALASNQSRFTKGTAITSLDPTLPSFYSFLKVEESETQSLPGGFEEVSVTLSGFTDDGEFETDREITYSSSNTLVERSILQNENFLADITSKKDRQAFAMLYNGLARAEVTFSGTGETEAISEARVIALGPDEEFTIWTDETTLDWYEVIFIGDHRTFMAPTYDWAKASANVGGLSNSELLKLGKIDTNPDGSPPTPPAGDDLTWLKVNASDVRGESSASKDEGWQWGIWPELIYKKRD